MYAAEELKVNGDIVFSSTFEVNILLTSHYANQAAVCMGHWTQKILNSGINVTQLSIAALFSESHHIGSAVSIRVFTLL